MKIVIGNIMGEGRAALLIENGVIKEVGFTGHIPESAEVLDYGDSYVLPGFVDIHIHGGGGYDFVDMTEQSFDGIRNIHLENGTTTLCPTLTSCPIDKTFEFLEYYKNYKDKTSFAGVHLEGPFLSPEMSGAQNTDCLAKPTDELISRLLEYSDIISSVTVAPELENCKKLIKALVQKGVRVSAGHSNASADVLREAKNLGLDKITHMYCATPKRYKEGSFVIGGFEEAALTEDGLFLELIADGHHVCRECFEMAIRCKGIDNIIAVSDAMRASGQDVTESFLGQIKPENCVIVEDGVAKLPDRSSFAGSVTNGEKMFEALCKKYGYSVADTSKMLSENPARYLGLENIGKIAEGYFADLVVIDNFKVIKTIKNGRA